MTRFVFLGACWILFHWSSFGWEAVEQEGLAEAFAGAKPVQYEDVGGGPTAVWTGPIWWVPNADGVTWDVVLFYYPKYYGPHQVVIHDFGSGETRQQMLEGRSGANFMFHQVETFLIDGKLYAQALGNKPAWFVYDPAKNELEGPRFPVGDEVNGQGRVRPTYEGDRFIGFGVGGAKEGQMQVSFYEVQIPDLTGRILATVDEVMPENFSYYQDLVFDGDWAYAEQGRRPWRIYGVDLKNEVATVIAETERDVAGDHQTLSLRPIPDYPGVIFAGEQLKGEADSERKFFWLRDGKLTRLKGTDPKNETPPWDAQPGHRRHYRAPYEDPGGQRNTLAPKGMKILRAPVDSEGRVRFWFRFSDPVMAEAAGAELESWQSFDFEVTLYPNPLRRMAVLPDGSIYGAGESYARAVRFFPESGRTENLGQTLSTHSLLVHDGLLYMSGYARSTLWSYDPKEPWTAGISNEAPPPLDTQEAMEDVGVNANTNPKLLATLMDVSGAHDTWGGSVAGADGRIYFGSHYYRTGTGGALAWWDPATRQAGSLNDPFSAYPVYWSCGAMNGKYIILSTKAVDDRLNPGTVPERGKLFIFDTEKQELIHAISDDRFGTPGLVVEAKPGFVMGMTRGSDGSGLLYGVDVAAGKILWTKALPAAPDTSQSKVRRWSQTFVVGFNGKVWANAGGVLFWIDPETVEIEVVGRTDPNQFVFFGADAYAAGGERFRKLVLPESVKTAAKP